MANKKTDSERLEAMFDALAESICNASDDELLEDLRQEGVDPEAEANRLKEMMLDTLKAFQQHGLVSAQEGYRRRVEQLEKKKYPIPESRQAQRTLFSFVLQQPQYAGLVTAQYRDLEDLSDEDIETCLEDLAELGILDEMDKTDDET